MKTAVETRKREKTRIGTDVLERLFHPRSIAIVGASDEPLSRGYRFFLRPLMDFGFSGGLYPVNSKASQVGGLKAYSNLRDIPGPVDYVISCIPAVSALQLVEDCLAKSVTALSFYTAGFSETGQEEGKELQSKLIQVASQGGLIVIGPNCLGVYCPASRVTFAEGLPQESGEVAFMSQSGGHASNLVKLGAGYGLRFSKVISYGNAAILNETDLLDYFGKDTDSRLIMAYIEGVREGQRFFEILRHTARTKPTIIFKGGATPAGAKAAASHTASLAGSEEVWDSLIKQSGAIRAHSIEECVDLALVLSRLPPLVGRNVAILGMGGGNSVQAADECEREGLSIPLFPREIEGKLRRIIPLAGSGFSNPLDSNSLCLDPGLFSSAMSIISSAKEIDILLVHIGFNDFPADSMLEMTLQPMMDSILQAARECPKPIVVALHTLATPRHWQLAMEQSERCRQANIAIFTSIDGAVRAVAKSADYYLGTTR